MKGKVSASLAVLTLAAMTSLCLAVTREVKVKYFSSYLFSCLENNTIPNGTKVFWISHNAEVLENNSSTSQLPNYITFAKNGDASSINISNINDDMFGYYTCVMVHNNNTVSVTRWGLNVDGADFSDLERQYRDNAIVGAIAAAVMLVLVGAGCVIWNYRYSRRTRDKLHEDRKKSGGSSIEDIDDDLQKSSSASTTELYHNSAYDAASDQLEDAGTEKVEVKVNGSAEQDGHGGHEENPDYRM